MSANPHRIEVLIETDGYIEARMVCDANAGAPCRLWCDHGCEYIHGHEADELRDQGRCVQIEGWFDDVFDAYSGRTAPLRSGSVDFIWEGDYYTWRYADEREDEDDEQ